MIENYDGAVVITFLYDIFLIELVIASLNYSYVILSGNKNVGAYFYYFIISFS